MEMTVWQGRRWSAANAYLRPALKRPNVQLRTGARAERILFEGRRAVGVQVRRWGRVETVRARKEVIVSASAINSPQLLMLSGIGPAEHLREHGIEVVANRPGVGGNLQDHLEVYVQQACTRPITLNAHLGLLARAQIGLAVVRARQRARRHQPFRGLRLHPQRGRASPTPTCRCISCRRRSAMMGAPPRPRTASRCISARCARPRAAQSGSPRPIRARRPRSASTT